MENEFEMAADVCTNECEAVAVATKAEAPAARRSNKGVAGMVLSIISLMMCFYGWGGIFSLITGTIGLCTSISARKNNKEDGFAVAGIASGIFSVLFSLFFTLIMLAVVLFIFIYFVLIIAISMAIM